MKLLSLLSKACLAFLALLSAVAAAPPNIVFIMTDQHSADALSCRMGDRYLKTPALDSLAARGTLFSRAYTPNPLCMPARNSIFTGRYPHETGITDKVWFWPAVALVGVGGVTTGVIVWKRRRASAS
jgi:choline-sulfatase